jgi:hypothetical protein
VERRADVIPSAARDLLLTSHPTKQIPRRFAPRDDNNAQRAALYALRPTLYAIQSACDDLGPGGNSE